MLNILPFSTDTGPAETNEQKHRPGLLSGQRLVESQVAKSSSTSRFNNLRDRPGLDVNTVLKMLKGSLPTTIAVAMQAIGWCSYSVNWLVYAPKQYYSGHNSDSWIPNNPHHNCFSRSSTTRKIHEDHAFQPFGDMCVYIYVLFNHFLRHQGPRTHFTPRWKYSRLQQQYLCRLYALAYICYSICLSVKLLTPSQFIA